MICTFIGHRDVPIEIKEKLKDTITDLIVNKGIDMFYIGNHGLFDSMAKEVLKELKQEYSINYYVVLAFIPTYDEFADYSDTIYIDELEKIPYKYRIIERNKWMINKSDYLIAYAKYVGNAREIKEYAEKRNKKVINLFQ